MSQKYKKTRPSNIGRRTGVNVVQGKRIRRQDDGTDVFDDYWTDTDSVHSNQTIQSIRSPDKTRNEQISENASILNINSRSLRSGTKRTIEQRKEEFEDQSPDISQELSKKSDFSKKNLTNSFEDSENASFARTKMTQTSYVLNETVNSRSYVEKTRRNEMDISDGDINSVRRSLRNMSNSLHSQNLLSSRGKTSTISISSPHEMETRKNAKNKNSVLEKSQETQISHPLVEAESSFHKNTTFTQERSSFKETERNKDLSLAGNAESVSSSGKKFKGKRSLRISSQSSHLSDGTESSPTKNTTYTPRRSHSKKSESGTDNLSDSEKNASVRTSKVLSEFFPTPSKKDFPSTREGEDAGRVSLSSNMKSGKKTKGKSSVRISTQSLHSSDETKSSPTKNTTYTHKRSHSEEPESDTDHLSEGEKNSSVRGSRVLSKIFSTPGKSSHQSNGTEDSSSKNTTCTHERSHSKETEENRVDSDREMSPPVERSSRFLFKTSSSTNRGEEVNKTNSSRRSSQHMANSHEVLSQKENESFQSKNRSEISVSGQKEKKKEDKRKSSMGKSPIPVKRTTRTSDISKNSLSETPRNQNRGKESSKRNFSGERFQLSTKSSEMLNPAENIHSRSNKSINGPEILSSHQRHNEVDMQESFVRKSPRAPQSKRMQTSDILESGQVYNNASTPVKTASPKHSAECKNEEFEVRKSFRKRFPPLASWRNERIKYVKSPSGALKLEGIDKGQAEDDYAFRYLRRRMDKDKRLKQKASIKKNGKNVRRLIKKTLVTDVQGKTVKLNLIRPFNTCEWTSPIDEGSNHSFMLCRVFASDLMTFGFLDVAAHGMKTTRYSPTDNIYFIILSGVLDVTIHESSYTLTVGDTFIVPAGIGYSIRNNTSRKALLNFTAFRVPFFKYQNKY